MKWHNSRFFHVVICVLLSVVCGCGSGPGGSAASVGHRDLAASPRRDGVTPPTLDDSLPPTPDGAVPPIFDSSSSQTLDGPASPTPADASLETAADASLPSILVCDPRQLNDAIAAAIPGDTIAMCDKTWRDTIVDFSAIGARSAPVTLTAQTPGKVIFAGLSRINLSGSFLVADGFVFRGPTGDINAFEFRSADRKATCDHCRITNSVVIDYSPADSSLYTVYVQMQGHHNRVDHCHFSKKPNKGQMIEIRRTNDPDYHRIDHNYFGERKQLSFGNFGEMIKIGGDSGTHLSKSFTVVEENYFYKASGEGEMISVKSGGNTIRRNTCDSSFGKISLRQGHGTTVEDNLIVGNSEQRAGGISVSGEDHVIRNNYIYEANRAEHTSWGAIKIKDGDAGSDPSYLPVKNITIASNTIIGSGLSLIFGSGRAVPPEKITIADNVVVSNLAPLIDEQTTPRDVTYTDNVFFGAELGLSPKPSGIVIADPLLKVGAAGLLVSGAYPDKGARLSQLPVGLGDVGPCTFAPLTGGPRARAPQGC